jgi:hypothetical protein
MHQLSEPLNVGSPAALPYSKKNPKSKNRQLHLFQKLQRITRFHERTGCFLGSYLMFSPKRKKQQNSCISGLGI